MNKITEKIDNFIEKYDSASEFVSTGFYFCILGTVTRAIATFMPKNLRGIKKVLTVGTLALVASMATEEVSDRLVKFVRKEIVGIRDLFDAFTKKENTEEECDGECDSCSL